MYAFSHDHFYTNHYQHTFVTLWSMVVLNIQVFKVGNHESQIFESCEWINGQRQSVYKIDKKFAQLLSLPVSLSAKKIHSLQGSTSILTTSSTIKKNK